MIIDWLKWCRLCGSEDSSYTVETGAEAMDVINSCFSVIESSSMALCETCNEFVVNLQSFCVQVHEVDKMYKELLTRYDEGIQEAELGEIRHKYGLTSALLVRMPVKREHEELEKVAEEIGGQIDNSKRRRSQRKVKVATSSPIHYPIKEEVDNVEYNSNPDKFNTSEEKSMDIDQEIERMIDQTPDSDDDIDNNYELSEQTEDNSDSKLKSERSNKFKCDFCQKTYSRRQTLEEHVRLKHGTEKDLKHQCEICQRKFISEKKLKQHSISHLPSDEKMVHPCPHCDKKFTKSVNVAAHINAIHIGLRPFICESCGRSFQSKGALKDHQITHSEERPWVCSQCPKRFKNQARLKTHEDIHNTTSYICPHCGLALNTKRTLKMHLVVHSTEKKYKCNYCGSEYKRSKALKNHLILHTGLRPYACPFCNKTFANGSNCRSHKKKAHPVELAALEASGVKSNVAIPRLEMLQPKATPTFGQVSSDSIELQELTEQHTITLPSLMTTTIDQCSLPSTGAMTTTQNMNQIQVIDMQHPLIHHNSTLTTQTHQQMTTQVISNQIPSTTTTTTYHVPVTMLSIIEQASPLETKHEPV